MNFALLMKQLFVHASWSVLLYVILWNLLAGNKTCKARYRSVMKSADLMIKSMARLGSLALGVSIIILAEKWIWTGYSSALVLLWLWIVELLVNQDLLVSPETFETWFCSFVMKQLLSSLAFNAGCTCLHFCLPDALRWIPRPACWWSTSPLLPWSWNLLWLRG